VEVLARIASWDSLAASFVLNVARDAVNVLPILYVALARSVARLLRYG